MYNGQAFVASFRTKLVALFDEVEGVKVDRDLGWAALSNRCKTELCTVENAGGRNSKDVESQLAMHEWYVVTIENSGKSHEFNGQYIFSHFSRSMSSDGTGRSRMCLAGRRGSLFALRVFWVSHRNFASWLGWLATA